MRAHTHTTHLFTTQVPEALKNEVEEAAKKEPEELSRSLAVKTVCPAAPAQSDSRSAWVGAPIRIGRRTGTPPVPAIEACGKPRNFRGVLFKSSWRFAVQISAYKSPG